MTTGKYANYATDNPVLNNALDVVNDNVNQKFEHDSELQKIQRLFERSFEVKDPKGARKISSKMLQEALWRTVNKFKFLDYQIHGTGVPEETEKIVTDGVGTVLDEGGMARGLRDKQGVFYQMGLYGDGLMMIGTDPNGKYPIQFSPISASNVYTDSYATGIRSGGIGKNATRMVIVFSMSPEEADYKYGKQYPNIKKAKGRIQRYLALQKEQERKFEQSYEIEEDIVEIAFYYDIKEKNYMVFAGTENIVLHERKGDKYPFVKDGDPYIPVSQFIFYPSSEGFWNYGLGHMLYDLAIVTRKLLNMAVGHIDENTYPITLLNVPKGEAAKFFNKLQLAHEMRAAGKTGMVAMEYDENSPNANRVQAQSLLTQNLMAEWQIVFDRLDKELRRMGINLDDSGYGPNVTATQILTEEESSNTFVKQVMEYNASECKFLVEITMDFTKKFINKNNKTPLNLTTMTDEEVDLSGLTMGGLSDELKKNRYFVKVNARSGAIPSNVMRYAQIARQLAITPPGSPGYKKLWKQYAALNDLDLKGEDFTPAAEGAPGEAPEGQPIPTETEKRAINPYEGQEVAV